MNGSPTPTGYGSTLGDRQIERAVGLALRAPSLHNSQPWRWRIGDDGVELHADRGRRLHETDPDGRDLLISCGAALHHLHVALAGMGAARATERFPDPEDERHLATVRLLGGPPDRDDAVLFGSLSRRRTDRRPYLPDPVAPATLAALRGRAARQGATLYAVVHSGARTAAEAVLGDAADRQRTRPGYLAELMTWTHRYAAARDGVPEAARPGRPARDSPGRLPPGRLAGPGPMTVDGGTLVVLTTTDDTPADRLRAGEATSAVLLAATRSGLATAPLSQALELSETRSRLARDVLHVPEHPQMIIRLGHAPDDRELPETPRRPLRSVLITR